MSLARLAWRDSWATPVRMALLSIGVAVGVAGLILILALSAGVENIVLKKVLGVLPDQIVVEPQTMGVGPIQLQAGASLDDKMIDAIEHLHGVKAVYRRVRLPLPAHINAEYGGRSFYTDVLVELVDPSLVEADVKQSGAFAMRPPDQPIPVVLPSAMIDILNMGMSVNTGLPPINPDIIIGRHFQLSVGSSSFKQDGPTVVFRCEIVGISPRVFVGGPSLPIGYLPIIDAELAKQNAHVPATTASSLTVMLDDPGDLAQVSDALNGLGLASPQREKARTVKAVIGAITLMLGLFAVLVLVVAGTGIGNGLALMVKDESGEIGLFRAVGASRGQIRTLYLLRAGVVGLCGGLGGLGIALLVTFGVNTLADHYLPGLATADERLVALSFGRILGGLAFGLVASVLAGLVPAQQAAKLDPASVLRER